MASDSSWEQHQDKSSDVLPRQTRRRIMKPITERLRRERINNNLNELKMLVLNALNEDVSQYSRMEKADILEMAVRYMQHIQKKKTLGKDCYRPPRDRSPAFRRTAQRGAQCSAQVHALVSTAHAPDASIIPHGSHITPNPSSTSTLLIAQNQAEEQDFQKAKSPSMSSSICNYESNPEQSVSDSHNRACMSPNTDVHVLSYNSKAKSPLKMVNENILESDGKNEPFSPTVEPKKRLPGMECFVQYRGSWYGHQANKENICGHFQENQFENRLASPYENKLFSPVWRPWY